MKHPYQKHIVCPKTGKVKVQTVNTIPSKTQQQFAEAADVNYIMSRAQRGIAPTLTSKKGIYADLTGVGDYREMLEKTRRAGEAFNSLDPFLRAKFSNDPQKLLEFLSDPKNLEEAKSLGLVKGAQEKFSNSAQANQLNDELNDDGSKPGTKKPAGKSKPVESQGD